VLVDFYHLAQSSLERVLPSICEKVLAGGERLLVVAGPETLAQLDGLLWTYAEEAFLPHGRSDGAAPEQQPILLSAEIDPRNGATNIALADGEWRDEALAFARTFYFFDNGHLDTARGAWRALKSKPEAEPRYWKQDENGKWVLGP
jgi:DNA polymerase III subunit chi